MADGLRFIPKDEATRVALAQNLICWADEYANEVKTGTCWSRHFSVDAAVCTAQGAPAFTSQGAAITCPAAGAGMVPYWIEPDDVTPMNINGCAPINPLPAPGGLAAGTATAATLPFTWSASTGATGYQVRWRRKTTLPWTTRATVTALTDTITGLTASTTYEVQVRAMGDDTHSDSPWSATVEAATTA